MTSSRADEFRSRLARWEEEYKANPKKTEITPRLIIQLKMLIGVVERLERDLKEAEEAVVEFLDS